jgi:hypothetical protein
MAGPTPIVRQIVLCERITHSPDTGYILYRPRVDFIAKPGQALPLRPAELWFFIQVTGSYGPQTFHVRLMETTDPNQGPLEVYRTPDRAIDLGKPPGQFRRRSRSWSVKLRLVPFPRPGWYEFWVVFNDTVSARVPVLMEAAE